YQNRAQINGGRNNMYVAMSNAGAFVMGYFDGSRMKLWKWAQDYTLADHFFMAAYGGSYLNHLWLVCACTPRYADAPASLRASPAAAADMPRSRRTRRAASRRRRSAASISPTRRAIRCLRRARKPSATRSPRRACRGPGTPAAGTPPPPTVGGGGVPAAGVPGPRHALRGERVADGFLALRRQRMARRVGEIEAAERRRREAARRVRRLRGMSAAAAGLARRLAGASA